ncbi:MAG TPA: hypothetical protein VL866_11925 [Pyrinomonadaceae bacterium]|nr:hypothetical protein [Pyrinomonadaceae bacterium]
MTPSAATELSLAPLGAGDLIDRAVRLYRRHLFILIRIAAPPVIVAAAGWILTTISFRQVFQTASEGELALYVLGGFVGLAITVGGYLFTLTVMGGATRNLVAHLLRNDPVSAKATYDAVRARFWGLLWASVLVLGWIMIAAVAALTGLYMVSAFLIFGSLVFAASAPGWFAAIVITIGVLISSFISLWVFFFVVGRVAYVPQVMLVEGRGIMEAFGRSFSLARGNVRRLMAMTLFTTFATESAMMILWAPLTWYGYINGIDPFNSAQWPAWYAIVYSIPGPLSSILLMPVWMLGLSLLYVDERVRHEGYDIELMASRQLPEMPDINVTSPLGTALARQVRTPPPAPPRSSGSVLNLG